jgi:hypothetical protein
MRRIRIVHILSRGGIPCKRSRATKAEEHDAYYLAAATFLPKARSSMLQAGTSLLRKIAQVFGTSSELVGYRSNRLGLWREHAGKQTFIPRSNYWAALLWHKSENGDFPSLDGQVAARGALHLLLPPSHF